LGGGARAGGRAEEEGIESGFVAHCGNDELIATLADLHTKIRRIERAFWGSADRTPSLDDHEEIITALETCNARQAERMLARNMARGLAWINPPGAEEVETQA